MDPNCRGEIDQDADLLHAARASDGEQTCDGEFAIGTTGAKHDLSPLHGRTKGEFGRVVGGGHAVVMYEDKELLVVREQGGGQIPHVAVGASSQHGSVPAAGLPVPPGAAR